MNQKRDPFDVFVRAHDPAVPEQNDVPSVTDPILQESRRQWPTIHARRMKIRRRMVSVAAAAIVLITSGIAVQLRRDPSFSAGPRVSMDITKGTTNPLAKTQLHESTSADSIVPASSSTSPPIAIVESDTIQSPIVESRMTRDDKRSMDSEAFVEAPLDAFKSFVLQAGEVNSQSWVHARNALAASNPRMQRNAVQFTTQLDDSELRMKAFELVCAAAGPTERLLLGQWMEDLSIRPLAWDRLIRNASPQQAVQMMSLARYDQEREQLCRLIAAAPHPDSVGVLIEMAIDPRWRSAAGSAMNHLNPVHVQPMILSMRQRDSVGRTAAGFLLASIPGDHLDNAAAALILSGRHRQPAYLVLLSRNTPSARSFLTLAASRADLNPALVSAQMHFATIQPLLRQWIIESKGNDYESLQQSNRALPELIFDHHLAGRRTESLEVGPSTTRTRPDGRFCV